MTYVKSRNEIRNLKQGGYMRTIRLCLISVFCLVFLAGCNDFDGDGVPDFDDCDPEDASEYRRESLNQCPDEVIVPDDDDSTGDDDDTTTSDDDDATGDDDDSSVGDDDDSADGDDDDATGDDDDSASDCEEQTWYGDADGDGFGNGLTATACFAPKGFVADGGDCDDGDPLIFPGAEEYCDGEDEDCDGVVDNNSSDALTFNLDFDGDGFGDPSVTQDACLASDGWVDDATDCDDSEVLTYPGANEICDGLDNSCEGNIDENPGTFWYYDGDTDGFGLVTDFLEQCNGVNHYVADATDCDDTDTLVNPSATEVCNLYDDNCDGAIDEPGSDGETLFYADTDGDGAGDPNVSVSACLAPFDYVADSSDCDDADAAVNTSAVEVCNGYDDNCDGVVDEGLTISVYPDSDGDGFGLATGIDSSCPDAIPANFVTDDTDCDDGNVAIYPNAPEVCNSLDDDCDVSVDEDAMDADNWYADLDGDGFGDGVLVVSCGQPSSIFVLIGMDCDDGDPAINPGALEVACDLIDQDCDSFDLEPDIDGDGYTVCAGVDCDDGDAAISPAATEVCNGIDDDCDGSVPSTEVDNDGDGISDCDGDCDDADASNYPGNDELCDGSDNDCDSSVDESDALNVTTWYYDDDSDGFGDAAVSIVSCDAPVNYVADGTDCSDSDPLSYPGASELCDGLDNDCNGLADADVLGEVDGDADTVLSCNDCDDADAAAYPGAVEVSCDGVDQDCDGSDLEPDYDLDGFTTCAGDCDDLDPTVNPGATEFCDSIDNNCDGVVDEDAAVDALTWYADGDSDGFGNLGSPQNACNIPFGFVADSTDCDDVNAAVYPGAPEYCNGYDDDCDGVVDENDAVDVLTWYGDGDGDGVGTGVPIVECYSPSPLYVTVGGDCDDADALNYPGNDEWCDGQENNCDGMVDDASSIDVSTWYEDVDADGFGDTWSVQVACYVPPNYVADNTDCEDNDPFTYPGAFELCDGFDNDCNGLADADVLFEVDQDGDGSFSCDDCDDFDPDNFPGNQEVCDGLENDCDVSTNEVTSDNDADTYTVCGGDCDDADPFIAPDVTEDCVNGIDDDCDGDIDELDSECAPGDDDDSAGDDDDSSGDDDDSAAPGDDDDSSL